MWTYWMLLAVPSACVVDLVFQTIWLPYSQYGGSLFHSMILRPLIPAVSILLISDVLAAILVILFLGATGSTLVDSVTETAGGHAWIAWLLIGAPSAWIGGQVIPASAVSKVLGNEDHQAIAYASVRAVLEQPGTMRKAALSDVRSVLSVYGSARQSKVWESHEEKVLALGIVDPRGIAMRLIRAARDVPSSNPYSTEVTTAGARLAGLVAAESNADDETVTQGIKGFLDVARSSGLLILVQAPVWADSIRIKI